MSAPKVLHVVIPAGAGHARKGVPRTRFVAGLTEEDLEHDLRMALSMAGTPEAVPYRRATVTREEAEEARSLVRSYAAGTLNVHLNGGEAYGFVAAVIKAIGLEVSDA